MTYEQTGSLAIRLEDAGEIIWARPRPEDENQLAQLMGGGPIAVSLRSSEGTESDTQGHTLETDVLVDVEGHALTLRLPTAADAEVLRRRLATGVIVATLVVAGAGAGAAIQSMSVPAANTIVAPNVQPGPAPDLALRREARLAEIEAIPPAAPVAPAAQAPAVQAPAVNSASQAAQQADVGIADQSAQQAAENFAKIGSITAPTTASDAASQAAQAADVGLADQSAQQAAQNFANSGSAGSQTETPDRHAGSGGPQEVDR
jgi:hypothetical protein